MAAPTPTRRPPADRARSNGSGPTPAAEGTRAFAGRSTGRKVKVPELAIGLLVTVAFALGAVVWQLRSTERVQAVVVASSIDRGDTITAGDLRVAYVSDADGVVRLDPSQSDSVVGQVALVDLRPGTMITPDLVAGQVQLDDGTGIAGLALEPGQYPISGLSPGDRVNVVVGPADSDAEDASPILAERAEVYGIEELDDGRLLISLKAKEMDANAIAAVSSMERFRLVQVPR